MTRAARDLVTRLRALQDRRHQPTQAKDHVAAHTALDLAVSLVDPADLTLLREALLHATNPASVPPIPVVFGPQDLAAVVGVDELLALVAAYATGRTEWGRAHERKDLATCHATERQLEAAYRKLRAAVEQLCRAVPVAETPGRLS
jgi:hypothetical protein